MNMRSIALLVLISTALSAGALASPPRRAQTIRLTPTSLTIEGPEGGPNPAPATLTVQNSGNGRLKWKVASSDPWLTVNPKSGDLRESESTDLAVSVNLTALTPGTHTASLTFTDPAATNSPQVCPVTVLVNAVPRLGVSPASLTMSAPEGGPNPPGQNVTVQNTGGGSLSWSASFSAPWLSGSPNSGTLGAGASQTIALSADVSGLAAGTHAGTLTVTAPGVSNSPQSVSVTLTVSQAPLIALSPANLSFDAPQGGANPAPQPLQIRNAGGGTLTWSASTPAAWLFVNPPSGTLPGGSSAALSVTVNTAGLLEGTYLGEFTFSAAGAANSPQRIPVVLNVNNVPKIGINPKTVSFVVATDAAQSSSSAVSVTNAGSGTLTWTATSAATWLNCSPNGGSLAALVSEPLFLSVNAAGMAPGHYTATVEAADPAAANSPQTVAVDLTVTESSLPTHAPAGQCGLLGLEMLLLFLLRLRYRGGAP